MPLVGGIDGCPGGWVVVTTSTTGSGPSRVEKVYDLKEIVSRLDTGLLEAVTIDTPIGLPAAGPRRCDVEARAILGPRRSSVFPAPIRGVLGSVTYQEALQRSRSVSGKGLSKQAFAILPKIEEVDALMTPERQERLVEVHPEVSFTVLTGGPMAHHKRSPEGRAERLAALGRVFGDVQDHVHQRLGGVATHDIVDAFVAAWSARRWIARAHQQLGGELDERGLRMEMIA